jgi:hypothetical protein
MMAARRRFPLIAAVLGVGVGILVSCAKEQPPAPATTASVAAPQPPPRQGTIAPAPPRPPRKPAPPLPPESSVPDRGDEALAMIEPEPAQRPSGPNPRPEELIGLDQPAATRLFGTAVERSEEPPATIWRYKTANCELDLFFYLDLRSGRMRTLHYAFKGDAADSARRQNCLRDLATRNS